MTKEKETCPPKIEKLKSRLIFLEISADHTTHLRDDTVKDVTRR